MDDRAFDELTKSAGAGTPRRALLKTFAAGVIGAAAVSAGLGHAGATPARRGRPDGVLCSKNADCSSGVCSATGPNGRRVCGCGGNLINCGGACLAGYLGSCASDQDCCSGDCVTGVCYSCFVAGTRVAMADGTSRNIEDVRVGDFVLGSRGQANRVSGVELPLLGARSLYALNGGRAFVTAEHPFATESGWKSVEPSATARENPRLPVGRLMTGDRMLTLAAVRVLALAGGGAGEEPAEIALEAVSLSRLVRHDAEPATQLYNLLLDGDHAYFADDFLVHNKN